MLMRLLSAISHGYRETLLTCRDGCATILVRWRRRQVVRQKSAKLPFTGSNPVVASIDTSLESLPVLGGVLFFDEQGDTYVEY